jgi:hypothetical protein
VLKPAKLQQKAFKGNETVSSGVDDTAILHHSVSQNLHHPRELAIKSIVRFDNVDYK